MKTFITIFLLAVATCSTWAQTNPTPQTLPYSQNFAGFTGSSTSYPAGWQGWTISGSMSTSFNTSAPNGNQALAGGDNSSSTAGVFDMNGKIGFLSTGSNIRTICLAINTTNLTNISVSWDAATQQQTSPGRIDSMVLQYRVGTSGTFTNVSGSGYKNNASSTINSGTAASNISAIKITLPAACENQSNVQLRWIYKDNTGSGNRPSFSIDNIVVNSATIPSITRSSPNQVSAGTLYQGDIDKPISNFQLAAASSYASLNSLAFKTAGTYATASDITNFKLWYNPTSNTFASASQIGTTQSGVTTGSTVTFNSLNTLIDVSTSGYFWITTTLSSTATVGTTLYADTPAFTFALSTQSGSISTAGTQTIAVALPTITLTNGTIASGSITQNTGSNVLYRIDVTVATSNATLNSLSFRTAGTYVASNLTNYKLWYSTNNSFGAGSPTNISTLTSLLDTGSMHTFSSLGQAFPSGATGYLFITTDLPCAATAGKTINVSAISSSSLTFASGTPTGSGYTVGGTKTIVPAAPLVVTSVAAGGNGYSGQVSVSWTNPTGCFDEVMIVVAPASNTANPTGNNGSTYNANLTYGSGTAIGNGFVVYKGSSSPQIIKGLTNGNTYYFKIYTRWDTAWTSGVTTEVMAGSFVQPTLTEIYLPQYIQGTTSGSNSNRIPFAYRVKLDNLLPNSVYRYINQVVVSTDASNVNGAGNMIFIDSNNTYSRSTSSSFSISGQYGVFRTNSSGSYTGWFITEPTSNSRFATGNQLYMNIALNDGRNGTTAQSWLRTLNTVSVINLSNSQTSSDGTGLYGLSHANAKNIVMVYDNENGSGRPISGTFVESDGTAQTSANNYATFYNSNVEGVSSAWGCIIPNANLSNGIRRVAYFDSTGNSVYAVTSSDGVWDAISTVSPTAGSTGIMLPRSGCSKLVIDKNVTLQSSLKVSTGGIFLSGGILNIGTNTLTDSGTISRVSPSLGQIDASSGKMVFANNTPSGIGTGAFTGNILKLSILGTQPLSYTHSLSVTDTLVNTGSFDGEISMSGVNLQRIIGTGVVRNLSINNSAGVTLANGNTQTISNVMIFYNGILSTNTSSGNGIILGGNAAIYESNSSYLSGRLYTSRKVFKNVTNTFGGLGLNINESTQDSNNYEVTRVTGIPISSGNPGAFTGNQGIKRYYTINPSVNSNLSANVVFYYREGELNGISEGSLRIYTHPDPYTNGSWTDLGGAVRIDIFNNTIGNDPLFPISHFSTWSFSSDATPLPLELVSLQARMVNGHGVINWVVANEDANSTYELYHGLSPNDMQWMASKNALANGEEAKYAVNHSNLESGIHYYQLYSSTLDGKRKLLGIATLNPSVNVGDVNAQMIIYPNPASNEIHVFIPDHINTPSKLKLISMDGMLVKETAIQAQTKASFDISDCAKGIYFINICGANNEIISSQRVVKY